MSDAMTRAEILWRLLPIVQNVDEAIAGVQKIEAFLAGGSVTAVRIPTKWTPELCRRVEEVYAETGSRMETARLLGLKLNSLGVMIRKGRVDIPHTQASPAKLADLARGRATRTANSARRRNGHAAA